MQTINRMGLIVLAALIVSCGTDRNASVSVNGQKEASAGWIDVRSILSTSDSQTYKDGEILVKFKADSSEEDSRRMQQAAGSLTMKKFMLVPGLERVRLRSGMSVRDAIEIYMADPSVEYAEPNYVKRALVIPNDTFFIQQWALRNTGQFANGTAGADIEVTDAWNISTGGTTIIAFVDTGIDYEHPDIRNNVWINPYEIPDNGIDDDGNGRVDDIRGWNFVNSNNEPLDDIGHGTHIAGIAGAVGNNSLGVSGVLWNVQLLPLKFLDAEGFGTIADEVEAIQYAVSQGAKIINASFSGGSFSNTEFNALSSANNAGVLVVAAAGNGGFDGRGDNNDNAPEYPANYNLPNIIAVAATDQSDRLASFSNFGVNTVDVAAPGVYILSAVPPGLSFSLCSGSFSAGYDFCSGTSMSAAYVSGLAALLSSYYTEFDHRQIRSMILRYADALPSLNGLIQTGGRINASRALGSLLAPTGLTALTRSSSRIDLSWHDSATGEDGYKIERSVSGGSYTQISAVGPGSMSYSDTGLNPSTVYSYRVRAYNSIPADSRYSNEATATTDIAGTPEPPPPTVEKKSSGGGGCSLISRPGADDNSGDIVLWLVPLAVIIMLMRRQVRIYKVIRQTKA